MNLSKEYTMLKNTTAPTCQVKSEATELRVQANYGSGTTLSYQIQGRLRSDMEFKPIALIPDGTLDDVVTNVVDKGVYTADIRAYEEIKAVATSTSPNNNTVIVGKIMGER